MAFYAVILVCNLVFNTCDIHQNYVAWDKLEDCQRFLAAGSHQARASLPTMGAEQDRYTTMGWCGPLLDDVNKPED